jgi:hypothetical protein
MKVAQVNGRTFAVTQSVYGIGGTATMPQLAQLADVDITGLDDGDILVWDDSTDTWVTSPSGGAATSLTPVMAEAPNIVTTDGSTVWLVLTLPDGSPVMI